MCSILRTKEVPSNTRQDGTNRIYKKTVILIKDDSHNMNEGKIRSKHCARDRKEGQQPHLIGEHVATYIPGCTSSNSWMSGFFVCMCVCVFVLS